MAPPIELGLDTFGDVTVDSGGRPLPAAQVIRNVVDEAVLADELGVDAFGVGEYHRDDFAVSPLRRCGRPSRRAHQPAADRLDLFSLLRRGGAVTWSGETRAPLRDQSIYPPIEHGHPRTWVGGSLHSVVRAATYGLPLMLAIIGASPIASPPSSSVTTRLCVKRDTIPNRSACTALATWERPTSRPAISCGPTTRRCTPRSAMSGAGRR